MPPGNRYSLKKHRRRKNDEPVIPPIPPPPSGLKAVRGRGQRSRRRKWGRKY